MTIRKTHRPTATSGIRARILGQDCAVTESPEFPFSGWLVWLTPEQGERRSGPPEPRDAWPHYAANATHSFHPTA